MSKLTRFFAMTALVLLAFSWGFLAHRNWIFPYSILRAWRETSADERLRERGAGAFPSTGTALEDLQALGYTAGTVAEDPERVGVVLHDIELAWRGANFFVPRGLGAAYLIDMDGKVLHQWRHETLRPWEAAELLPDGGILLIVPEVEIVRLSAESEVIWRLEGDYHHQPVLHGDQIWALERRVLSWPEVRGEGEVYDDFLVRLDLDGNIQQEISMIDVVVGSPLFRLLPAIDGFVEFDGPIDLLHTNNLEVFDGRLAALSPHLREEPSALVDQEPQRHSGFRSRSWRSEVVLGSQQPDSSAPPAALESGNILLFDNGAEQSAVIEVDPRSDRVVWRYSAEGFHSPTRGSVQRLPNGNTLITESDSGRAFEVSPDGEVVWSFEGPIVDPEQGLRGAIWRMSRYPMASLDFLE